MANAPQDPLIENQTLAGALVIAPATSFIACRFDRCVLQSADLSRCSFVECRVSGSNLAAVRLVDAEFRDVSFVDSKLAGIDWTLARSVRRVSFANCVLDDAAFVGMQLRETCFRGSRLRNAVLAEADLAGADLSGCDLTGAHLAKTVLTGADLRRARGYAFDPRGNAVAGLRVSWPECLALLAGMGVEVELGGA